MNLLTIENISKQYSERLLFDHASLMINEGDRIGLIGVNGSGKSTLLKIVAALETPDAGSVKRWGQVTIEFLTQEPELDDRLTVLEAIFVSESPQMQLLRRYEQTNAQLQEKPEEGELHQQLLEISAEMDRTGGWAAEANAKAILTKLDIARFDTKIRSLSGGQRKRVALARALIDRADLLILDEPTNHLDADTVAWLEDYLANAPGALLMVTHDRYFLDRVVNRIVELDRRQLVSYAGNYSQYLEGREARHERLAEAERKRQKLLKRELEWVRRAPTARGTKQKARKQRVEELLTIQYDSGEDQVAIDLASRRLGKQVLTARGLTKHFDTFTAVDGVDFHLDPGDRIGIIGPNGAGKSTFLNMLAGASAVDSGSIEWGETVRLGYYDQRAMELDDSMRLIEFIENEAALMYTQDNSPHWIGRSTNRASQQLDAPQMLEWFLFPRSMQYGRIGSLSGGERRRLYLLRTLIHQPNVLFLDEPTNDLDIQTLGVLESFLDRFVGCLVVISHDRYFLDRTVDHICYFDKARLGRRYPAPYSSFKRLYDDEQKADVATKRTAEVAPASASSNAKFQSGNSEVKKRPWKEQRELEMLELKIEQLEGQIATLQQEMADTGSDYLRLQELSTEVTKTEAALEEIMERWLELA